MFSKELMSKALYDQVWRENTALGRKVASSINVHNEQEFYLDLMRKLNKQYPSELKETLAVA